MLETHVRYLLDELEGSTAHLEVEARPPTTDLVATLKSRLGRKELAKAASAKSAQEHAAEKRPARRRRAS